MLEISPWKPLSVIVDIKPDLCFLPFIDSLNFYLFTAERIDCSIVFLLAFQNSGPAPKLHQRAGDVV